MRYTELAAVSNFSFLRGASHPRDLVLTALLLGHAGIGIADRNSVAGVVRAHTGLEDLREDAPASLNNIGQASTSLKEQAQAFKLVTGARLVFADRTPDVIAYPQNREGWSRLCRLLTKGKSRAKKGDCLLYLDDLLADARGLLFIVMPDRALAKAPDLLQRLSEIAPGAVWLAAAMLRRGDDRRWLAKLRELAGARNLPILAVNDVLYAEPGQRDLQDVLTCIREGVTITDAGRLLEANSERYLKAATEMARLFQDTPEAIAETGRFLDRIAFSLDEIRYEYPEEPTPSGWTPQTWLEELTQRGAAARYPTGVPKKVADQVEAELALIAQLDYAPYFLTIHDIVQFATQQGILCQGRGSAANSAVCYLLGITAVDPSKHELLFARFISAARKEPPDIDIDFEHERREEVIQYVYEKYGRDRAGIVATVISYRPRSAIRDVGKALGLSEDVTARLADTQWGSWGSSVEDKHIREAGLDPTNPILRHVIGLVARLVGFPRHLSQHVGGFVLTRDRLDDIVPIGNAAMPGRTFIEWDKDDIDALRLMKVDILALGMLTCIRKAFDLLRRHEGVDLSLSDMTDEQDVYDMLSRGDSLGVFQVESRAQMNMLPRLKPRQFYDLVIQVAIVRPGPIQGEMVHPYLRRRAGSEEPRLPSPAPPHDPEELNKILKRTEGVPLFQEQAMSLAIIAAEFSEVEANHLRRAMATFRNPGTLHKFKEMMVGRMVKRGYQPDFARRCFEQIKGFGSYGFPESHAASFAKLVYVSAWIKCRHPAVFACALLNSQPMGFYAPAQIIRDAQEHGVKIHPVDLNSSSWNNTLERGDDGALTLRLGFRQVVGLQQTDMERLVAMRGGGYHAPEDLATRGALNGRTLRLLSDADAFRSLGFGRREALWRVRSMPDAAPLPLFAAASAHELAEDAASPLPVTALSEEVAIDYQTLRLSLKGHPMGMLRKIFRREGVNTCAAASTLADGSLTRTAGIVLVRQRPGSGNTIFVTVEDETGIANIVVWARVFERFRKEIMGGRLLQVEGKLQRSPEGVVHLIAERIIDRSEELKHLWESERPNIRPSLKAGHPRNIRLLPRSRDFH